MLIHQGKVLKDETTLEENKVDENGFIVDMLSKSKSISGEASTAAAPAPQTSSAPAPAPAPPPVVAAPSTTMTPPAAVPSPTPASETVSTTIPPTLNAYGQVASVMVIGSNVIQQILDMGGGSWDRDTVIRALGAAFNNPERAVEYLYSGIPDQQSEVNPQSQNVQATAAAAAGGGRLNANPLNLFPQDVAGRVTRVRVHSNLDSVRNNPQHPRVARLIRGDRVGNLSLTVEEMEAIQRLEAMGFDRSLVIHVFLACNKNEELSANYLLDHMDDG